MGTEDTAVIDLGSNTVKLVVYRVERDGTFRRFRNESMHVKLGENQDQIGFLDEAAMNRTVEALKGIRDTIESIKPYSVLPVATSAVREAANGGEFMLRVMRETGLRFRTLSTKKEALHSYFGAVHSLGIPSMLFFDLGGGSLEIVLSRDFVVEEILSMPLGVLRTTQLYSDRPNGSFSDAAYDVMRAKIADLVPHRDDLDMAPGTVLVGAGGTLRNIAKFHQSKRRYPFAKLHNYALDRNAVSSISDMFQNMTPKKIARIGSINPDRAGTITAGSCVIDVLMECLGFGRILASEYALREGTLYLHTDFGGKYDNRDIPNDLMRHKIREVSALKPLPPVVESILRLLEEERLGTRERLITSHALDFLPAASDSPDDILRDMMGEDSRLSHREQLISSLAVVECRRRGTANRLLGRFGTLLKPGDKKIVKKVAALLAVCNLLSAASDSVSIRYVPGGVSFDSAGGKPGWQVREAAQRLSESFDIRVECG